MTHPSVWLISGGSRGLGAGLVETCLKEGDRVATFSRSRTAFIERCEAAYGDRFLWRALDALDYDGMREFVQLVESTMGSIDTLVNTAAGGLDGVIALARPDPIRNTLLVNVESAVRLTQRVVRVMLRKGHGSIVNVTSVNGIRGYTGVAVYSATKAAIDGMTRSLARELGERGVRVNSVAPGYFESEMVSEVSEAEKNKITRRTPLGRLATIDEIVKPIRFLASDDAAFVTGQILTVDGGLTC